MTQSPQEVARRLLPIIEELEDFHRVEALFKTEDVRTLCKAVLAGQWQPIETAPEDMTEPVVVRWTNSEGEEAREFDYREDGCWMGWHDHAEHVLMIGGHGVSEKPPYERWMPLPPPPTYDPRPATEESSAVEQSSNTRG